MYPILLAFVLLATPEFPDVDETVVDSVEDSVEAVDNEDPVVDPEEDEAQNQSPPPADLDKNPPREVDAAPEQGAK